MSKTKISMMIEDSLLQRVDKVAEKLDLPRGKMVENLIAASMVDVKLLESMGFLELARMVRKVQDRLKNKVIVEVTK